MITAQQVQRLINYDTRSLSHIVDSEFATSRFLGITNGGEFCYSVGWHDSYGPQVGKVFLKWDPTVGKVRATVG